MSAIIILLTFLSTIEGIEIRGILLSKIMLIVFVGLLILKNIRNIKNIKITKLLLFYCFTIISGLLSLTRNYPYDYKGIVIKFIIQIAFIYLPLLIVINNDNNRYKYYQALLKGLRISIFIHSIWGIMQMLLYSLIKFDLNQWFFDSILGMHMERGWTLFYYTGGKYLVRMSGLNFEPAIFGLLLSIGVFIEKNKYLKVLYLSLITISLSRTGLMMCIATYLIKFIYERKYVLRFKFYKRFIIYLVLIFAIISVIVKNESLNYQLKVFLNRFNFKSEEIMNDGTGRHIKYYPRGIEISLFRSNIIEALLGYGPRVSGIAFNENKDIADELYISSNKNMANKAWTVECDEIAILLGHGAIGLLLYWMVIYDAIKYNKRFKYAIIAILIGGIMYHFYSIILINLILIFTTIGDERINEYKRIKADMSKE